MDRFEYSPGLFGYGVGHRTHGDFTCDRCGTKYNEGAEASEDYDNDGVLWDIFAGHYICEECFGDIESAVLGHMGNILPWYTRFLKAQRERLQPLERDLREAQKEADGDEYGKSE